LSPPDVVVPDCFVVVALGELDAPAWDTVGELVGVDVVVDADEVVVSADGVVVDADEVVVSADGVVVVVDGVGAVVVAADGDFHEPVESMSRCHRDL